MAKVILIPYSHIVGQEQLKLALEIAYIARLNGVLIRGQRGTGKSTAARSFAQMIYGRLPVTLPINATEDRVVGGWNLDELLRSKRVWRPGLLEQAHRKLLFVDEINLLEDHIVNIILDVTSTNVLTIQQNDQDVRGKRITFMLVGTMNPDEGELRPQLLDRFSLTVHLNAETDPARRLEIVNAVLAFDRARESHQAGVTDSFYSAGLDADRDLKARLTAAREVFDRTQIAEALMHRCIALSAAFGVHGHRADILLPIAARATAARAYAFDRHAQSADSAAPIPVTKDHVQAVAPLVLMHRRQDAEGRVAWDAVDDGARVQEIVEAG
jgi:magnesium chelatase subunit I